MLRITAIALSLALAGAAVAEPITPAKTAVFINSADPVSVGVGNYYVTARGIPAGNVRTVSIPLTTFLTDTDFNQFVAPVIAALPSTINAIAITWARPYKVREDVALQDWERKQMSITAAFTFGTGPDYFKPRPSSNGCVPPSAYPVSPLYDAPQSEYFQSLGLRLTMMVAAQWYNPGDDPDPAIDAAKVLIDRGKASDKSNPILRALLVRTTNDLRSLPRQPDFELVDATYPPTNPSGNEKVAVVYWNNDNNALGENFPVCVALPPDYSCGAGLMAYETGHWCIPDIRDNTGENPFLPGAFASHLTSFGGALETPNVCVTDPGPEQMTILRWIEAGVTGTSGTVREPCANEEKFHQVSVLIEHYLARERLIEAQWKSVACPYELLFVGEPLATPYKTKFFQQGP